MQMNNIRRQPSKDPKIRQTQRHRSQRQRRPGTNNLHAIYLLPHTSPARTGHQHRYLMPGTGLRLSKRLNMTLNATRQGRIALIQMQNFHNPARTSICTPTAAA